MGQGTHSRWVRNYSATVNGIKVEYACEQRMEEICIILVINPLVDHDINEISVLLDC